MVGSKEWEGVAGVQMGIAGQQGENCNEDCLAEWSKALASGASPLRAWVRIPQQSFFCTQLNS